MKLTEEQMNELVAHLVDWMRERLHSTGAKNAVVGISGGKDSATVAALCVKAYGKDHVFGVLMPDGEQSDIAYAEDLCKALDIESTVTNIHGVTSAFYEMLEKSEMVDEISRQTILNLPPRVRMTTLYAIAQSKDAVVVNTSNLSEDWVGYATIYGDTTGAFSPLAMLTTDEVVQLGRALGLEEKFVIKPPSDGLTGKTDEDVLGFTYATLNDYIREGKVSDELKPIIDRKHLVSRFKFQTIPMFNPHFPIVAEDIAHVYDDVDGKWGIMARKKFEDGFKEEVVAYCKAHPEKTIKACAEDKGIGYSTLRRWLTEAEEKNAPVEEAAKENEEKQEEVAPVVEAKEVEVAEAEVKEETPVAAPKAEEKAAPHEEKNTADAKEDVIEAPKAEEKPEPAPIPVAETAEFKAKVAALPTAQPAKKTTAMMHLHDKAHNSRPSVGNIVEGLEAGVGNVMERLGRFTKQLGMKKRKK